MLLPTHAVLILTLKYIHRKRNTLPECGEPGDDDLEADYANELGGKLTCPEPKCPSVNCNQCKRSECKAERRLGEHLFPFTPDKEEHSTTTNDLTQFELIQEAKLYATKLGLNEEDANKVLQEVFNRPKDHRPEDQEYNKKYKNVDDFLEAKKYAAKLGLDDKGADEVISRLFDSLSDADVPLNSKLEDKIKENLSDPDKVEFIEKLINKNLELNGDKYSSMLALQLIGGAMDRQTGELNGKG